MRFPLPVIRPVALASACTGTVPAGARTALKEVVTSGSQSEQSPDTLAQNIDVLNARQIEQRQIRGVRGIRDLARELPNVSVQRAPARFTIGAQTEHHSNAGFNILWLDGNRAWMVVDGVRQRRSYLFPCESAIGRDDVDVGLVKRIVLVRGPTSALYGSDGIGGMVDFFTNGPAEFLRECRTLVGQAIIGYEGDVDGWRAGATLTGKPRDDAQWLLSHKGRAVLGRLVLQPVGRSNHVFTAELVDKSSDYALLSNIAKPPRAATSVVGAHAATDRRRNRLAWDGSWQPDAPWAERLQAMLAWQEGRSNDDQFEDRHTAADRSRNTVYLERTLQGNLQSTTTLRSAAAVQRLTCGIDVAPVRVENLQTGSAPPAGESFPLKRFCDTKERAAALCLQVEIVIGRWAVTPGVRHDRFKIDASAAGCTAPVPPVSISDSATSPKLGVVFQATDAFGVYGHYAVGFKAPTAGQVNGFYESPIGHCRSVSNPDLKPEKSRNLECGLRGRFDDPRWDLAVLTGRFKDFIEDNRRVAGAGAPGDPLAFRAVNVGRVKFDGFELEDEAALGRVGTGTLAVAFTYGHTRGRDRDAGRPINSVNPERIGLGLVCTWGSADHAAGHHIPCGEEERRHRPQRHRHAVRHAVDHNAGPLGAMAHPSRPAAHHRRLQPDRRQGLKLVRRERCLRGTGHADTWTQPGRYARLTLVADF